MFQIITSLVKEKKYSHLSDYLQKFSFFRQAKYNLSSENYMELVEHSELFYLKQSQSYQISQNSLYAFFGKVIITRNTNSRQSFTKFNKRKSQLPFLTGIKKQVLRIMPDQGQQLKDFQLIGQDSFLFGTFNKIYALSPDNSAVGIKISSKNVSENIISILKEKYQLKVQFLINFEKFSKLNQCQFKRSLKNFEFRQYKFDEYLYNKKSALNEVFFLQHGEVQICLHTKSMISRFIARGPSILADEKLTLNESARCISEKCVVYAINKVYLQEIIHKEIVDPKQNQKKYHKIGKSINELQQIRSHFYSKTEELQENKTEQFQQKIEINKILGEFKESKFSEMKQYSNIILNSKYQELIARRQKHLQETTSKNYNSVLYIHKQLTPHEPNMKQINQRLKYIRSQKYQKCKNQLLRSKQNSIIDMYKMFIQNGKELEVNQQIKNYVCRYLFKKKHLL